MTSVIENVEDLETTTRREVKVFGYPANTVMALLLQDVMAGFPQLVGTVDSEMSTLSARPDGECELRLVLREGESVPLDQAATP